LAPLAEQSATREASRRPASRGGDLYLDDRVAVAGDVVRLIWQHKLWWLIPMLLALVVLGALLVLEATPVGPLLYPVF
jgi:hypothetical protein